MDRSTFLTPTPQDELGKDGKDEIIEISEKTSTIATFFVFLKSYLGSGM
jgi:hypothetical protein